MEVHPRSTPAERKHTAETPNVTRQRGYHPCKERVQERFALSENACLPYFQLPLTSAPNSTAPNHHHAVRPRHHHHHR